ncbi:diamine N-acetyltransferase [Lachnospiraceae bacterium XBD2001]|nr:diamine N-acetyltransferase [Lachnospiraceae bacterium XBD2001]
MEVRLRHLQEKDAPLMLEWMHDEQVLKGLQKNFMQMSLQDAISFIQSVSYEMSEGNSLHYAIADEADTYLGTISLKDIDLSAKHAEYAITMRSTFHGKGIGTAASRLLLEKAFVELGLERVFLTVLADNDHAKHMYERCGFCKEGTLRKHIFKNGEFHDWDLYGVLKTEFIANNQISIDESK